MIDTRFFRTRQNRTFITFDRSARQPDSGTPWQRSREESCRGQAVRKNGRVSLLLVRKRSPAGCAEWRKQEMSHLCLVGGIGDQAAEVVGGDRRVA